MGRRQTFNKEFKLEAVRLLEQRRPAPSLLHHSDQGSQYLGSLYIKSSLLSKALSPA